MARWGIVAGGKVSVELNIWLFSLLPLKGNSHFRQFQGDSKKLIACASVRAPAAPAERRGSAREEIEMAGRVGRVVIIVQGNHTTDNYFRGLAPYGGAVVSDWPLTPNPPAKDPAHDRHAYFDWLTGGAPGAHVQF